MQTFLYISIVASAIYTVYYVALVICNRIAIRQRRHLMLFLYDRLEDPDYKISDLKNALLEFNDKSYKEHVMRLMTFRDPYKLYQKTMILFNMFNRNH